MAKKKSYDVIVIGAGSAGFSAALAARELGARVCLIEKGKLGGECPNYGCVPSKSVLKAAKVYKTIREAKTYGIQTGSVSFDFASVMAYKEDIVDTITGGGEYGDRFLKIAKQNQIEVVHGQAEFLDEKMVQVDDTLFEAKAFVLATGAVDFIPPIKGLDSSHSIGWKEALTQKRQPKSMAIIGGGPVGCEIATFYNAFGSRVTLFHMGSVILDKEDPEIAKIAHEESVKSGIEIVTNSQIQEVVNPQRGVYGIKAEVNGELQSFAVDQLVITTGKRSNVEGLNIEAAGVELDDRGNIRTNEEKRTSAKHIFAAGDVDGGMQFTHTAHYEGDLAGRNAAMHVKGKRKFLREDERVVPRVTFTIPEIASVGMTGPQVKEKYKQVLVGRASLAGLGRSLVENTRVGAVKIVAHPKTRKVLGGHVAGDRAGEVLHELALAMYVGTTVDKLASMLHAYPTLSEGVANAAGNVSLE